MRAPLLVLLMLMLVPALAAAQDDDVDKARAHFRAGEAFFAAGLYDRAVDEYRAAQAIAPRPQLLFNIGSAYRKKAESTHRRGDLDAAIAHYRQYLEVEPAGKGAESARVYLDALEAEARVTPPDPEPPPPAAQPAPPPALAPPPPAAVRRVDRGWRTAGLVTAGAGVALLATGVGLGLAARAASSDLQGLEDDARWDMGKYDAGRRNATLSKIALGAGAAAIAAGAVFTFVLGKERTVTVAPTPVGLSIGGTFR